jgi:hypothetical protein
MFHRDAHSVYHWAADDIKAQFIIRMMKGLRRNEDLLRYKSLYHNYFYAFPKLALI